MKSLMKLVLKLARAPSMTRTERYLARSVDAHDLEFRVQVLERYRG